MLSKPQAVPKPKPRRKPRNETRAKAFRDSVWRRERSAVFWDLHRTEVAVCQNCGLVLQRNLLEGEVHHLRGRNVAPQDKYNPDAAVLWCRKCHRAYHEGRLKLKAEVA